MLSGRRLLSDEPGAVRTQLGVQARELKSSDSRVSLLRAQNVSGMRPERLLVSSSNDIRLVKRPISVGIVPAKLLPYKCI
jgi:hypothetical protein